ncbi:MAG: MotA/TolQ/ExbB proton channel family protein [Oscillospiraceae bacterium]|nr:MotA/TolQ/ExbB proton channel family protein [Oscillospiraceae bacterium]
MSFWEIIGKNLLGYDLIIFIIMIATVFLLVSARNANKNLYSVLGEPCVKRKENNLKLEPTRKLKEASEAEIMEIRLKQDKLYGAFVTFVSVFPLLGMIGTVYALLKLDLTGSNDNITNNFFGALTSTFWGAIFGVVFKIADCILNPLIEDANERYRIGIERRNLDSVSGEKGEEDETKQDIS